MTKRAFLIAILLLAAGCAKSESKDAFRNAVMEHLASRPGLDVSKMDVDVEKVTVNGDRATVDVTFRVKGGTANQGMNMSYEMVRTDGAWKVQGTAAGHGAGASPRGDSAPPMSGGEKAGSSGGFHPDTRGGAGGLPPGHPPMNPPATSKQ